MVVKLLNKIQSNFIQVSSNIPLNTQVLRQRNSAYSNWSVVQENLRNPAYANICPHQQVCMA
jgi:hypothetical protein